MKKDSSIKGAAIQRKGARAHFQLPKARKGKQGGFRRKGYVK